MRIPLTPLAPHSVAQPPLPHLPDADASAPVPPSAQADTAGQASAAQWLQGGPRETEAANRIQRFFREAVAANSYDLMFRHGAFFQSASGVPPRLGPHASFKALQHLETLSHKNLSAIRTRVGTLSPAETPLCNAIIETPWRFRHQTNAPVDRDERLNLLSNHMLARERIASRSRTGESDRQNLRNDDFVFFGVEFAAAVADRTPVLNRTHHLADYGGTAFLLAESDPRMAYGYLTLTDHLFATIAPAGQQEHYEVFRQFPRFCRELSRDVVDEQGHAPVFSTRDMKQALALHLIEFVRQSQDDAFKQFAWTCTRGSENLHRLLNTVFAPEFHVPRMVSTRSYAKHVLYAPTLRQIVETRDMRLIDIHTRTRDRALSAMLIALELPAEQAAVHLLNQWNFSTEDFSALRSHDKALKHYYAVLPDLFIPISSSEHHAARAALLDLFLARKIIAVDDTTGGNGDQCLLQAAVARANHAMIDVLMKRGADYRLVDLDGYVKLELMRQGGQIADFSWRSIAPVSLGKPLTAALAVKMRDLALVDAYATTRERAIEALIIAIKVSDERIVAHLFDKWQLTVSDHGLLDAECKKTSRWGGDTLACVLSGVTHPGKFASSAAIVDRFLAHGVVGINDAATRFASGNCMMAVALEHHNHPLIERLLRRGADYSILETSEFLDLERMRRSHALADFSWTGVAEPDSRHPWTAQRVVRTRDLDMIDKYATTRERAVEVVRAAVALADARVALPMMDRWALCESDFEATAGRRTARAAHKGTSLATSLFAVRDSNANASIAAILDGLLARRLVAIDASYDLAMKDQPMLHEAIGQRIYPAIDVLLQHGADWTGLSKIKIERLRDFHRDGLIAHVPGTPGCAGQEKAGAG